MSRPKSYAEDELLRSAMHTFRVHGYAGTSIKHLEQATGLRSGSLYHGYGDKAGLFGAALAHYNDTVVRGRIARFLPAGSGLDGLRRMFRSLLQEPGGGRHGCLLTNSAIEFGAAEGGGFGEGIAEGLGVLQQAFEQALAEAQARVELPQPTGPLALRLLAFYQGLLVLVRAGRPDEELGPLIDAEFAALAAAPTLKKRSTRRAR